MYPVKRTKQQEVPRKEAPLYPVKRLRVSDDGSRLAIPDVHNIPKKTTGTSVPNISSTKDLTTANTSSSSIHKPPTTPATSVSGNLTTQNITRDEISKTNIPNRKIPNTSSSINPNRQSITKGGNSKTNKQNKTKDGISMTNTGKGCTTANSAGGGGISGTSTLGQHRGMIIDLRDKDPPVISQHLYGVRNEWTSKKDADTCALFGFYRKLKFTEDDLISKYISMEN